MTITREELWQRLQQQALVDGEVPALPTSSSPWYVRVMLGIAGWIGALFLLGFVGVGFTFVMKSAAASMMVGALCCGGAYAIFRAARENDFATQFGLAVSLAGQGVFLIGLFNAFKGEAASVYLLIFVFEATLALLLPNFIHRVLTSAGAAIALSLACNRLGLPGVATGLVAAGLALVWLDQRRWAASGRLWRPIGYGLALALLQIEAFDRYGWRDIFSVTGASGWLATHGLWIASALTAAIFVWTVLCLLRSQQIVPASRAGMAAIGAALLVGVLSFPAPGLATALLILLLGFACGNRILMGLGLLALLGFVSHYYYELEATLLVKSAVLASSGAALLAARLAMNQLFPINAEKEHHHA